MWQGPESKKSLFIHPFVYSFNSSFILVRTKWENNMYQKLKINKHLTKGDMEVIKQSKLSLLNDCKTLLRSLPRLCDTLTKGQYLTPKISRCHCSIPVHKEKNRPWKSEVDYLLLSSPWTRITVMEQSLGILKYIRLCVVLGI